MINQQKPDLSAIIFGAVILIPVILALAWTEPIVEVDRHSDQQIQQSPQ
jgi:hypothetical protein